MYYLLIQFDITINTIIDITHIFHRNIYIYVFYLHIDCVFILFKLIPIIYDKNHDILTNKYYILMA